MRMTNEGCCDPGEIFQEAECTIKEPGSREMQNEFAHARRTGKVFSRAGIAFE